MNRSRIFFALFALLGVSACTTVQFGRDFDPKQFEARVERGITTRDQVRQWMGAPVSRGAGQNDQGQRYEEWSYYYGHGSIANMQDANLKILQVRFDLQGRVTSYSWTGERSP
jgi:outer membrane protein assembly factor BamE (lipoprotein component of BamABCDE complex)